MVSSLKKIFNRISILWISIPLVQRLVCPRFGSTLFSRLGRIILLRTNASTFFGGVLVGLTLLFFLYAPVIEQFDNQYSIAFGGQRSAYAQESEVISESDIPNFVTPIITTSSGEHKYQSPLRDPPKLLLTSYFSKWHPGYDLATDYGTPIYASKEGIVESVEYSKVGYGNAVYISHDEEFVSLYAHMSRIIVKTNQPVSPGTVIGYVGSTGRSTGPHVHFELRKNQVPLNPKSLIGSL